MITDSVGRPWRLGTLGIAIGCAGVSGLTDLRGTEDLFGRLMETSEISPADSRAAAATLMMGEGAEGYAGGAVARAGRNGDRPARRGDPAPGQRGSVSVSVRCALLSGGIGGAKLALGWPRSWTALNSP